LGSQKVLLTEYQHISVQNLPEINQDWAKKQSRKLVNFCKEMLPFFSCSDAAQEATQIKMGTMN
jgi:hypothetical protein